MNAYDSLPAAINSYLTLVDSDLPERAVDSFVRDACVVDDGHIYRGPEQILSWLTGPASEWVTTSTLLSEETTDDLTTVVTRITGNFPGGEVELTHQFVLTARGLIRKLTITA